MLKEFVIKNRSYRGYDPSMHLIRGTQPELAELVLEAK